MPKLIPFTLALVLSSNAFGQEKRNAVYSEIGKTLLMGSLVFDHLHHNQRKGVRAIVGFNIPKYRNVLFLGAGVYYLIGANKSKLELGGDLGYIKVGERKSENRPIWVYPDFVTNSFLISTNIGFRGYGRSTLIRAGISPFAIKDGISMGAYIGAGFRF